MEEDIFNQHPNGLKSHPLRLSRQKRRRVDREINGIENARRRKIIVVAINMMIPIIIE